MSVFPMLFSSLRQARGYWLFLEETTAPEHVCTEMGCRSKGVAPVIQRLKRDF